MELSGAITRATSALKSVQAGPYGVVSNHHQVESTGSGNCHALGLRYGSIPWTPARRPNVAYRMASPLKKPGIQHAVKTNRAAKPTTTKMAALLTETRCKITNISK